MTWQAPRSGLRARLIAVAAAAILAMGTSSGCAYIGAAVVIASSGGGGGGGGKKAKPSVPVIFITTPARQVGDVSIDHRLQDGDTDPADILVEYSVDGGSNFLAATEGAGSDGTMALPTSESGIDYTYVWDSLADLGGGVFPGVLVRITPSDEDGTGKTETTGSFDVGNDAPSVTLGAPAEPTNLIQVDYTLTDSSSDLISIQAQFSTDGVNFAPATVTVGSLTNLQSSPTGVTHSFAWNSQLDVGTTVQPQTVVRLTPSDDFAVGAFADSPVFTVDNNDSPAAFIRTIPRQDGDVSIDYVLLDPNADNVNVTWEYSSDGGMNWPAMTLDPASVTTGLATSQSGIDHNVVWDSVADIGTGAATVFLRVTPDDLATPGQPAVSESIVVGNEPPTVTLRDMSADPVHDEGIIRIDFTLFDTTSDPADLEVRYSTDGWTSDFPATISVGATNAVASDPAGKNYAIAWTSTQDLQNITMAAEIRIVPTDRATGTPESGPPGFSGVFTVSNFDQPIAFLASPVAGDVKERQVTLSYLLFESASASLDIRVEYSTDGSTPSLLATEGAGGDGVTTLSSSPGGTPHIFVWDSAADLGALDSTNVRVTVTPVDGAGTDGISSPATPAVFLLNNNTEPSAILATPSSPQEAGDVALDHSLRDAEGDPVDIVVEFSTDAGISWATATEQPGAPSEGTTGLSSGDPALPHVYVWDSIADGVALGAKEAAVLLRVTPSDNAVAALGDGPVAQTVAFEVDNTIEPAVNNLANLGNTGNIPITYDLFDTETPSGPTVDVTVEFSTDGGTNWEAAQVDLPSDGALLGKNVIQGQTPSAVAPGAGKSFEWNTGVDIGETDLVGVGLRLTPMDTKTGTAVAITFDVVNNDPPAVVLQDPAQVRGDLFMSYTLSDTNGDLASITPEYSTASFAGPWLAATESSAPASEGTTGLVTSPAGIGHTYVWDSVADLGLINDGDVWFRITPSDGSPGTPDVAGPFLVANDALLPSVRIDPIPARVLADDVTVNYLITDGDFDPSNITVEYQVSGGGYLPATERTGGASEGTTGLSASPGGIFHIYVWDSAADLGPGSAVTDLDIRITPSDNDGTGIPGVSNLFTRGNDAPSIANLTPPPAVPTPGGLVEFSFDLFDSTSDPVDVTAEFSADSGFTWALATISVGGTSNLFTSPTGIAHNFAWNSLADLGIANFVGVQFRVTPTDSFAASGAAATTSLDVSNNDVPISFIGSPNVGDVKSGPVGVAAILIDGNSDTITATVDFSTDGGATWAPASLANASPGSISGNTITGLPSSPAGLVHNFDWLSGLDLPGGTGTGDFDMVRVRITPDDPQNTGVAGSTLSFLVDNNNEPAVVKIDPFPPGDQSGAIPIDYTLADPESDTSAVAVHYSTDGGLIFAQATISKCLPGDPGTINGHRIENIPSSPLAGGGTAHCIVWESDTDLGGLRETSVVVRFTPADNSNLILGVGLANRTGAFVVDNTAAPEIRNLTNATNAGTIRMDYDLFDADPAPFCDVTVTFSTDGGTTFEPATIVTTDQGLIVGNMVQNQVPSDIPDGAGHYVDWNSDADIGLTDLTGVIVRLVAEDSKVGPASDRTFDLNNNDAPEVLITDINGIQAGDVSISYSLRDSFSDTLSITVEYDLDGAGTFGNVATESTDPGSQGTSPLSSGPMGQEAAHLFIWDSLADLSTTVWSSVQIRITATDPFITGAPADSNPFEIDNAIRADLVLGQDSLFKGIVDGRGTDTAVSSLASGISFGFADPELFIPDFSNHRALKLNAIPTSDFQAADVVLGQPNFTTDRSSTGGLPTSAQSIRSAKAVYTDGTKLYVSSYFESRVLIWDSIPTANQQAADHVLGQVNFTNGGFGLARNRINRGSGVAGDGAQLFVADEVNNRVLVWDLPIDFSGGEGPDAQWVIGKNDFVTGGLDPVGPTTLERPQMLWSDGTTLYIADRGNNRVTQYDLPIAANGVGAVRVLGQPDDTSEGAGNGLDRMNAPVGVHADASQVYVADRFNHRVLIWNGLTPATGSAADWVLGQPGGGSSVENQGGRSETSLSNPIGVYSTGSKLLIADAGNHRVKIHDPIPAANNAAAQIVWGQEDWTSGQPNHIRTTPRSFLVTGGVDTDGTALFVADRMHHRVLGWNTLPAIDNKNAEIVFGQPDFTSEGSGTTDSTLNFPHDVAYDPAGSGRLFVADSTNSRIVVYDGPFGIGQAGSAFLGQMNPNSGGSGTSQTELNFPWGVSWDGTYLWVADTRNNRALRFSPPFSDGMPADIVVGQADFMSGGANHSGGGDPEGDQSIDAPHGLVSTGTELLIADADNNRVLVWNTLPTTNDEPATAVIGQGSFGVPAGGGVTRNRMQIPTGVESVGNAVYVSDAGNYRILIWNAVPAAGNNGLDADKIIGQPTFTSRVTNWEGVSDRSLKLWLFNGTEASMKPAVIDSGGSVILWAPDPGNARVLRYDLTP